MSLWLTFLNLIIERSDLVVYCSTLQSMLLYSEASAIQSVSNRIQTYPFSLRFSPSPIPNIQ